MNTGTGSLSAWDVPRPRVRLGFTLALGLLGALLFPARMEFVPNPFAAVRGAPMFAWLAAAFAAVRLLRRVEDARVPGSMYLLLGLALVFSLMVPSGVGMDEASGPAGVAWIGLMGLLLVVAGALASGGDFRRRSPRHWADRLLRGPAVALAAPLLLFASRPDAGTPSSSLARVLSRVAFALFPYALAAGFGLTLFGFEFYAHARWLGMACLSFSLWAWLGCGLLFLLGPWPHYPRVLKSENVPRERVMAPLGTALFAAMALLALWAASGNWNPLKWPGDLIRLMQVLPWPWLGCALFFIVSPWPAYPRLPKLGRLPRTRGMGPAATALFLALALVPMASFAYGTFLYVISGRLFASGFDPVHVGGALDQPSLTKCFFVFTYFTALVFPYVAAARWASDRSTRWGSWAFALPAVALCVCLLSVLTVAFWWTIQYIDAMGFTLRRVCGLVYGLGAYTMVLGFLCWAVRSPGAKTGTGGAAALDQARSAAGEGCPDQPADGTGRLAPLVRSPL